MSKRVYLIGITGGSASGKTLFIRRLMERFESEDICLISQDNYYIERDRQPVDSNGVRNFDLPRSVDAEAFVRDIKKLTNGQPVERKEYTYNNPGVTPGLLRLRAAPLVIAEGLFVMHFPEIKKRLNLTLFIDAKDHIRLKRRIIRDNRERGYGLDDVLYRFEKHVMPAYDRYLEPVKAEADIIIPNNNHFDKALDVVSSHLRDQLKK